MIADKIKEICSEKRMTIPQLAEKIGMSKGFYTTLKNNTLRVDTLLKIAEVLEVPVSTFFEDENDQWPKSKLIEEVKKLDEEKVRISKENEYLLEIIRAKRGTLRRTYTSLNFLIDTLKPERNKTANDELKNLSFVLTVRIKEIVRDINESEDFENSDSALSKKSFWATENK